MIHEDVSAGNIRPELHNRRTTRRHECRLHLLLRDFDAAFLIHLVENLADDVERRQQVRPAVSDEEPDAVADFRLQRFVANKRTDCAVEDDVARFFVHRFILIKRLQSFLAEFAFRIKVALHHVVFLVHRRQTFLRFHEDETIHAVRHMHAHRCSRAVIDIQTGIQRLERKLRFVPRRSERRSSAAARSGHRVKIDVVRHLRARMIFEVKLHHVALTNADEKSGDLAAKRPKQIVHAIRHALHDFFHFEVHAHLRRVFALNRWRHIRCDGQHGFFLADNFRVHAFGLGSGKRRGCRWWRFSREDVGSEGESEHACDGCGE